MRIDRVSLSGAALGAASLLFPPVTLKPNRVDDGTALSWIDSGAEIPLIITIILLVLLSLSAFTAEKHRIILLLRSLASLCIAALLFYVAGPLAGTLVDESIPYGRISLSSGFWLMLGGLSVLFNRNAKRDGGRWGALLIPAALLSMVLIFFLNGSLDKLSLIMELYQKQERLVSETANHLRLAGTAVFLSLLIGVPLGLLSAKRKGSEKPIFHFLNSVQTIPSLALFGLLIAPLSWLSFRFPALREMGIRGVGSAPALIALTLYALLPVARNTFTGLSVVDPGAVQAGRGMGMNRNQLFFRVELPMALPVILTGIRISAIQAVGNTAVAALIGAGGLGTFIFQGLGQGATDLILLGVLPLIALAVVLDRLLLRIINLLISPGLRSERTAT